MDKDMHGGIDEAEKDNNRLNSFDEAIQAMVKLTASFNGFEKTQSQMKEVIGDLAVSKYEYIKSGPNFS